MMAPSVFQRTKSPRQSPVPHKTQSPRYLAADSGSSDGQGAGRGRSRGSSPPSPPSASGPESFECVGEGELDNNNGEAGQRSPSGPMNRHSWTRTSLRRTPPSTGKRQLGSNALASQLYRSSSFNSSGCGSTGDPGEDMYSDVSLEEDVQGLNYKVQLLQQQVTVLADTQSSTDDRYARAKADNAVLQARVHTLEEQLRDIEVRCDERIAEEQRRCREAISRVERDRDSQVETLNMRLSHVESEAGHLKQEAGRLRGVSEGLRMGADAEAQRLRDIQDVVSALTLQLQQAREAHRKEKESHDNAAALVSELQRELERTRGELAAKYSEEREDALRGQEWGGSPDLLRLEELHQDLSRLRQENKDLSEAHDELQAQMLTKGLETGRSLLGPPPHSSLAAELTEMTNDQFDGFAQDHYDTQIDKMQKALIEQQDVNGQLRSYIDGILLQIVENYPQLLEVKHSKS